MAGINNRKGQSFLSGDIPSIIMIVVSIGFFLSSVFMATEEFNSKKATLRMEAALVDASSVFLKENAKIKPSDITDDSESGFWALKLKKIEDSYGVQVYVELISLDPRAPYCASAGQCVAPQGVDPPPDNIDRLSKRFPIALRGATDLEVYPALVKVIVYIG